MKTLLTEVWAMVIEQSISSGIGVVAGDMALPQPEIEREGNVVYLSLGDARVVITVMEANLDALDYVTESVRPDSCE